MTALWTNGLRSGLTTTGIVIGVATVTAVVSFVQGLNNTVTGALETYGAGNVYLQKHPVVRTGADRRELADRSDFTLRDVEMLEDLESVGCITPMAEWWGALKTPDGLSAAVSLTGTDQRWPRVSHRTMETGRFFTRFEVSAGRAVCVIGADVAERLFGNRDPVGRTVQLDGRKLTVLGVVEGMGEVLGSSQDRFVLVPYTIFGRWADLEERLTIGLQAAPGVSMEQFVSDVEAAVRRMRGLSIDRENDFEIITSESLVETYNSITAGLYAGMVAIASVALLVGSVGIANIMLVSVTERTREIGVRKALGATRAELIMQFLSESVMLALVGGVLGILLGYALAAAVSGLTPIPSSVEPWSVIVAFMISAGVGIGAGLYPAYRAARMSTVDALCYRW